MSAESDIATILQADTALNAILTGGIYAYGDLPLEGIAGAPDAFDNDGLLKPIAIVKQRGQVPTGEVVDYETQAASAAQVVAVWRYQRIGYDKIDASRPLIYKLLQGKRLGTSFEMELVNELARQRDDGALKDASMECMDFAVYSVMLPV